MIGRAGVTPAPSAKRNLQEAWVAKTREQLERASRCLSGRRTGGDNLLRRYVYGARLISMTSEAGTYYFHDDALGSVANLTSAAGTPQ